MKECPECQKLFPADGRARAKYCSDHCKRHAARRRAEMRRRPDTLKYLDGQYMSPW